MSYAIWPFASPSRRSGWQFKQPMALKVESGEKLLKLNRITVMGVESCQRLIQEH